MRGFMLELESVTDTYILIVKKGILTDNILTKETQKTFIIEWFLLTALLPNTCSTSILTDKDDIYFEDLDSICKLNKDICVVSIFEEPILCFYFEKDGIIFEPLSPTIELTFKEWSDLWMYDLRVHGCIGYLLLLLDRYKIRMKNED